MKKFIVITLLVLVALTVAVLTFIIGAIKMIVGGISLGALVILLIIVWIAWKVND